MKFMLTNCVYTTVVVDDLLHLVDECLAFCVVDQGGLTVVHLVVRRVVVSGVAPRAPLALGHHRQHEVGVDVADPVPQCHVEIGVAGACFRVTVVAGLDRERGRGVAAGEECERDSDLCEVVADDLELALAVEVQAVGNHHLVHHWMCRLLGGGGRHPDAVGTPGVAELVELGVGGVDIAHQGSEVLVLPWPGDVADEALDRVRVPTEDDLDDAIAIDRHRQGPLHLRVEQLAVLLLRWVGVPRDVGRLGARDLLHDDARFLGDRRRRCDRHLVDPVELARLEIGEHGIFVGVVDESDRVDV